MSVGTKSRRLLRRFGIKPQHKDLSVKSPRNQVFPEWDVIQQEKT
jgi:hypothetical protein